MNCTLSVVMPVYNTEPLLLDRSVGSLLDQEYRDLELILVDDGSGEQTARRLDQLAEQDTRIRVIRQENQGASAARNAGIRAASGRFLTMMDADDAILPEAYGDRRGCGSVRIQKSEGSRGSRGIRDIRGVRTVRGGADRQEYGAGGTFPRDPGQQSGADHAGTAPARGGSRGSSPGRRLSVE